MRRLAVPLVLCLLTACGRAPGGVAPGVAPTPFAGSSSASLSAASGRSAAPSAAPSSSSAATSPRPTAPVLPALPPAPPARVAITFPDAQDGWAAGVGVILHTSDGGRTWAVQHRGQETFLGLDFPNAREGWALTTGSLLHTEDGGGTWTPVSTADLTYAIGADFLADGEGWVATIGHTLWDFRPVPDLLMTRRVAFPGVAASVHLADAEHGWVAGDGHIYATSDGGMTWTLQLDALQGTPPEFTGGGALLTFPAPAVGWALFVAGSGHASQRSYALYRTDNGGRQWRQMLANRFLSNADQGTTPVGPGGYAMALAAPDPADAYLAVLVPAAGGALVTATHDGGRTWSVPATDARPVVRGDFTDIALAFTDARHGWLATLSGQALALWSTDDGGATWSRRYGTTG